MFNSKASRSASGKYMKNRIHTNDLKHFEGSAGQAARAGETILDKECPQWLALAEKLENSAENRSKINQLDKRLTQMLLLDDTDHENEECMIAFDEVEATCKLQEYKVAIHREITDVKLPMLQAASTEWSKRLDNTMLEQMVLLDRIDSLAARLTQIEQKLDQNNEL